jgi:C4-dicarboxylate-binding protein DctP
VQVTAKKYIEEVIMKRAFLVIPVVLAIGWFMCGTLFAAPVIMRVSLGTPEGHFITTAFQEWARMVEQNSKGEIKVQIYFASQLFRDNEIAMAIQRGGVEAGNTYTQYLQSNLVPTLKVLQMPFLFKTLEEALKVIDSDIGQGWRKTAEQKGVKLLGFVSFPSPDGEGLVTTKPVKVPADVKAMVIRTISPEISTMIKRWGAGPSFLSGTEIYMGLQRGTIHGAMAAITGVVDRKLYEVAPYWIALPYSSIHGVIAVNKSFFDRLSPTQQKAIVDASNEIHKNNYNFTMNTLKKDLETAKVKVKMYYPTEAELAKWTEGSETVWAESARSDKDAAEVITKVRAMLKR